MYVERTPWGFPIYEREGRKKEKTNTKVHGILKKKEDRERGTDFPSRNPYLYIPWQQTEGSFVVVVNSRPIPVPKKIHEKTTMISERTERESRLVVDKFYDPVICKYVSSAALSAVSAAAKSLPSIGYWVGWPGKRSGRTFQQVE